MMPVCDETGVEWDGTRREGGGMDGWMDGWSGSDWNMVNRESIAGDGMCTGIENRIRLSIEF